MRRLVPAWHQWSLWQLRQSRHTWLNAQDESLRALLALWSRSAREALCQLTASPPSVDEATLRALGGLGGLCSRNGKGCDWLGGQMALATCVSETSRLKALVCEERKALAAAAARSDQAASRVDDLFATLHQNRASATSLAATTAQAEMEALCLERTLRKGQEVSHLYDHCPLWSPPVDPGAEDVRFAILECGVGTRPTAAGTCKQPQHLFAGWETALAQLVAEAEADMYARFLEVEAKCCAAEGRLDRMQNCVQRMRTAILFHGYGPSSQRRIWLYSTQ